MSIQGFSSLSSNATSGSQLGADVGRGGRERRQLTEVARMGGLAFDRALDAKRREIGGGQAAPRREDTRGPLSSAEAGYGAQTAQIDARSSSRPMPVEVSRHEPVRARRGPPEPPPGVDEDARNGGVDDVRDEGRAEATSEADAAADDSIDSTEAVEAGAEDNDGSIDISGFDDVDGDDDFVIEVESESGVDGIEFASGEQDADMLEEVSLEEVDVSTAAEVIVAEQDIVGESDEAADPEDAGGTTRAGTVQSSAATASGAMAGRSSSPVDRGWTASKPLASAAATSAADVDGEITEAGTMGKGKARVVIGEGKERVVLNVSLTDDNVRVLARAASNEQAEALSRNADSLAAALEERGLNLSNLAAHSDSSSGDHDGAAGGSFASPVSSEGVATEEPTNPDLSLRGVRVVA